MASPDFKNISLSVILPAFNESSNLNFVLRDALYFLSWYLRDFEILVVNDGSTDDSQRIIEKWVQKDRRVQLINTGKNLGYGAAFRKGLEKASKSFVMLMDCDQQFSLKDLCIALPLVSENVFLTAYRRHRADSIWRLLLAWGYRQGISKGMFGLTEKDINCAFKLFPRNTIDMTQLKSCGAFIGIELILRAKLQGITVKQFPVEHYPRISGKATGGNLRVIFQALRESWALRNQLLV